MAQTRARLRQIESQIPKETSESPFLKKLPPEVRDEIYKLLLVNPELGKNEAAMPDRFHTKFGLQPAILRTCRKISDEALAVLYKENSFAISCLGEAMHVFDNYVHCPLTRHSAVCVNSFKEIRGFSQVRNWTVVLSRYTGREHPPLTILNFCQDICDSPTMSISIRSLSPKSCAERVIGSRYSNPSIRDASEAFELENVLNPFRLLRNLNSMNFELCGDDKHEGKLTLELKHLTESSISVDHPFDMYDKLLVYAQAFSSNTRESSRMKTSRWIGRMRGQDVFKPNALYTLTAKEYHNIDLLAAAHHPVERGLELAKFAGDDLDVNEFKVQRKAVLNFLEAQYNRIMKADMLLVDFVAEQHKLGGGVLIEGETMDEEDTSAEWAQAIATGTLILEDYAKALQRDLTPEIRALVRFHGNRYDNVEEEDELDRQLTWLTRAMKNRDWDAWQRRFIAAGNIMAGRYLKIRQRRKELFSSDRIGTDHGCDIVVDERGRNVKIDWFDNGEDSDDELSEIESGEDQGSEHDDEDDD